LLRSLKRTIRRAIGCRHHGDFLAPERECIYQEIVRRDLARFKVDDVFYPLGWAANYGLFYLILRASIEFEFNEVVELGAGQSSLLLDGLSRANVLKANIRTVEHNSHWAEEIGAKVSHAVVRTNLIAKTTHGFALDGYDFSVLNGNAIDFLIVDGPPGGRDDIKYSRFGALDLIDRFRRDAFLIIVDDADREAEDLLARIFQAELTSRGFVCSLSYVISNKRQAIISGGKYAAAAFY
jgi:hypothetical protein